MYGPCISMRFATFASCFLTACLQPWLTSFSLNLKLNNSNTKKKKRMAQIKLNLSLNETTVLGFLYFIPKQVSVHSETQKAKYNSIIEFFVSFHTVQYNVYCFSNDLCHQLIEHTIYLFSVILFMILFLLICMSCGNREGISC